jgi:hypothetical protein
MLFMYPLVWMPSGTFDRVIGYLLLSSAQLTCFTKKRRKLWAWGNSPFLLSLPVPAPPVSCPRSSSHSHYPHVHSHVSHKSCAHLTPVFFRGPLWPQPLSCHLWPSRSQSPWAFQSSLAWVFYGLSTVPSVESLTCWFWGWRLNWGPHKS